jgi:hypothetical protein
MKDLQVTILPANFATKVMNKLTHREYWFDIGSFSHHDAARGHLQ